RVHHQPRYGTPGYLAILRWRNHRAPIEMPQNWQECPPKAKRESGGLMPEQRDRWTKAEVISKIISALFLPIALLWLGTWLTEQQRISDEKRSKAEGNANRLTTLLKSLSSDNARERLLATKVTEYFGTQDLLPSELVPVLVEISAKDPDK